MIVDLHDVCDVIAEKISVLEEECDLYAVETQGEALPETEAEIRRWRWCLDVVREASRKETG